MKKKLLLLGLFIPFVLHSCYEELTYAPESPEKSITLQFRTRDAQRYFEHNATDLTPLAFSEKRQMKTKGTPVSEMIPLWDQAIESGNESVSLIEIPLRSTTIGLYTEKIIKEGRIIRKRALTSQRRLIVARRSDGQTDMFITTIIPADGYHGNMNKFRYLGGGDFTGQVFCSTLEGEFVKAFGYTQGHLNGTLIVMKRSKFAAYSGKTDEYNTIHLSECVPSRAMTYSFDEDGSEGIPTDTVTDPNLCPHGYAVGECPTCMEEVVVTACPVCGTTNGCTCPKCLYCGEKENDCNCVRCIRCQKKMMDCTCYFYPDFPDFPDPQPNPQPDPNPNPQPNPGGNGSTGGGGSSNTGNNNTGTTPKPTAGKVTAAKITNAASNAAKAMLVKYGKSTPACNRGVQAAFNELYSSKELDNKNANTIVNYWTDHLEKWESIKISDAQDLANEGWFVVAGWINDTGSGHVVVIVPGEERPGWKGKVPVCMDTGRNMKTPMQGLNYSFGKDKKDDVKFFKYK